MFSKDILNEVKNSDGIKRKKSQVEINQEGIDKKVSSLLVENKYIQDTINKIKEQIAKGKEYKFSVNRDKEGLIKEIIAIPVKDN